MSIDDVVEQQEQEQQEQQEQQQLQQPQQLQQQTFETPEFMSEWTNKQKSGKIIFFCII